MSSIYPILSFMYTPWVMVHYLTNFRLFFSKIYEKAIEPAVRSLEPNPLNGNPQQLDKTNSSTKGRENKETKRHVVAMMFGADIFLPIDYITGDVAADVSILPVMPGEETIPYRSKYVRQKNKSWSVVDLSCARGNACNLKGVPISVVKKYSCGMGSSFVESPPATSSEEGGEFGADTMFLPGRDVPEKLPARGIRAFANNYAVAVPGAEELEEIVPASLHDIPNLVSSSSESELDENFERRARDMDTDESGSIAVNDIIQTAPSHIPGAVFNRCCHGDVDSDDSTSDTRDDAEVDLPPLMEDLDVPLDELHGDDASFSSYPRVGHDRVAAFLMQQRVAKYPSMFLFHFFL